MKSRTLLLSRVLVQSKILILRADVISEHASTTGEQFEQAAAIIAKRNGKSSIEKININSNWRRVNTRSEELGRLLSQEEGKPLAEGLVSKNGSTISYYGSECLRLYGERYHLGFQVEISRESWGVVITCFPIAIPAWKQPCNDVW